MTRKESQSTSPTDAFNAVGEAITTLDKFLTDEPGTVSKNAAAMRANLVDQAKKKFLGQDTLANQMLDKYSTLSEEEKFLLNDFTEYNPRTTLNPRTHPEVLLAFRIYQVELALDNPGSLQMPEMTAEAQAGLLSSLNNLELRQKLGERFPQSMTTKTLLRSKTALDEMHQDGLS